MKDYTTNYYCDFLWINDLLNVSKGARNMYQAKITKDNFTASVSFVNVIIFGTIIEIKQTDLKKFIYLVDDGTGVISCVHSEMQFEDAISTIEREHEDVLNHSLKLNQSSLDQSSLTDASMEDSIFNEKSIQDDEQGIIKRNLLQGLQSIWNDIYDSFTNLLCQYNIGDCVLIEGKLYTYLHKNQIYINNIRPLELSEEIVKVSNKLRDGYNPLRTGFQIEKEHQQKRRCSGLMTFDNVHHLSAKYPQTRTIDLPKDNSSSVCQQVLPEVVPPHVESTITFDTFNC